MSEFKKWLAKNHPYADNPTIAVYKESWRAAIGWANTKCRAWVTLHGNVYSDINAELMKLDE